jgi:hypothetical protein
MQVVKLYFLNLMIAIDQLINAILLGSPDETLSSRAYRAELNSKIFGKILRPVIDVIFFFDKEHCKYSYLAEIQKRQLPAHFQRYINART